MIGDDAVPEVTERSRVGDDDRDPGGRRPGGGPAKAPRDVPPPETRITTRTGTMIAAEIFVATATTASAPAAAAKISARDRRRVASAPRARAPTPSHSEGRSERMRAAKSGIGGEIVTRAAAKHAGDRPGDRANHKPDGRRPAGCEQRDPEPDPLGLISERCRDRAQDPVEGGGLRREDIRPQVLPRPEGRDGEEVDALVEIERRRQEPREQGNLRCENDGQAQRLEVPSHVADPTARAIATPWPRVRIVLAAESAG